LARLASSLRDPVLTVCDRHPHRDQTRVDDARDEIRCVTDVLRVIADDRARAAARLANTDVHMRDLTHGLPAFYISGHWGWSGAVVFSARIGTRRLSKR